MSLALDQAPDEQLSARRGSDRGESGRGGDEADAPTQLDSLDDRLVRRVGILAFGLAIPRITPLLDGHELGQLSYWLGTAWFVGLAAAIWHGNRWLLFEQRRHYGWFNHPVRKLMFLLAAIVLYTAPLTIAALSSWYGWTRALVDWDTVRTVALINVICVVFVTHAYETVFLIKEREGDLLRVTRLDRARAEAELAAFLAQVDPHFMFNSLNTLDHLIETDPARAQLFNRDLARVYRYLLRQRGRSLVPLSDELEFCRAYVELMTIRHGPALRCELPSGGPAVAGLEVPPTALQLLIENAIKHNEISEAAPLDVEVEIADGVLEVQNEVRPRRSRPSAGLGLPNLDERSKLAIGRGIEIDQSGGRFRVRVPLAARTAGRGRTP